HRVGRRGIGGDGGIRVGEDGAAVVAAHARGGAAPVAGAAQIAGDDVGGGAQVLRQARLDRQGAAFARVVRDDGRTRGDDDEPDGGADEELDDREAGGEATRAHHWFQHLRLTAAAFDAAASG